MAERLLLYEALLSLSFSVRFSSWTSHPPQNPRLLPNEHQFASFVENNRAFCQETGSHAVISFRNTWKSVTITDSDVITSVFKLLNSDVMVFQT